MKRKIIDIKEDNQIVVWLLIAFLLFSILLYVVYPPLRNATGIYGFIVLILLGLYTNPAFQDYLYGIEKSAKTIFLAVIGAGLGLFFVIIPKIIPGLSMGLPVLPASVESNLQWIIICIFAPFVEDILRFGILGLILYVRRKGGTSKAELWTAIIIQALFFMLLHATAYAAGWYSAPEWTGALSMLGAVTGSLITAFLFALITGYFVTRDGIKNIALSIAAHYAVNQFLFVKFSIVFLGGILL